jgi:hypothetical protein
MMARLEVNGQQVIGVVEDAASVVARLRARLVSNGWQAADIDLFIADFADNADALAKFESGVLDFDVWKKFASLTGDTKAWVRKSVALQERIKAKGLTNEQIDRLKDYYSTHNSPSELTTFPNTSSNGIYFDEFGHPDFIRANAISERNHIVEIFMDGTNDDYNRAYSLLSNKIGDSNIRKATSNGSSVYIKINDVETGPFTWHHHQDGKSMIPVLQTIHTRTFTPHTGGRAIVGNGLVNFFDAP